MSHTQRTLPYIRALLRVKSAGVRSQLLHKLPPFVVDDIAAVIYNIVLGNVKISRKYKSQLSRIRHSLYNIIRAPGKAARRKSMYKQSGTGVFIILLPALASVISSIVANHV